MSTTTTSGTTNPEITSLIAGIGSGDDAVREHARAKLVDIGAAAVPALIDALTQGAQYGRWEAAKALSEIADPRAANALVGALEDEDGSVRWIAAEGLIRIGAPSAVPILEGLVVHSESAWLREGAHHVLGAIGRGSLSDILKPVRDRLDGVNPRIGVMTVAASALRQLKE